MRPPTYSTREIIVDFTGETVPRKGGPAALGHNPSWVKAADLEALAAELADLRGERDQLEQQLDSLYGMKFSDRVHHALKSRAERAEADLAALRGAGAALHQQWREQAASWTARVPEIQDERTKGHFEGSAAQAEACVDALESLFSVSHTLPLSE